MSRAHRPDYFRSFTQQSSPVQSPKLKIVYLSLGSNLGDRAGNIRRAREMLSLRGVHISRQSALYETEPVGLREQPWFLNCVIEAETNWMPRQLLHTLLEIERELGRQRRIPGGPRAIDLDILLFGSSIVRAPDLVIPHPRMAERRFVLAPLNEIAPAAYHPVLHMTAAEIMAATSDTSQVRLWNQKSESRE